MPVHSCAGSCNAESGRPAANCDDWRVSVDASRCAADSTGYFEIVFTRLQEFGLDTDAHEEFTWAASEVTVAVIFTPTEVVPYYRIGTVTPCPCASK